MNSESASMRSRETMNEPPTKIRKRIREACEPCRRKKGKCPGERPVCSLCARLNQQCSYLGEPVDDHEPAASPLSSRVMQSGNRISKTPREDVDSLHNKLDKILDTLSRSTGQTNGIIKQTPVMPTDSIRYAPQPNKSSGQSPRSINLSMPPRPVVLESANLFLKYCHCQPLPLFALPNFTDTLLDRDPEVVLSIVGLAQRFRRVDNGEHDNFLEQVECLEEAQELVSTRLKYGPVQLSTIQCSVLSALASFYDGDGVAAGQKLTTTLEITRTARLERFAQSAQSSPRTEEHVRALWSIIMLQYLIGGFGIFSTRIDIQGLRFPSTDGVNELVAVETASGNDAGVTAYALQMTEAFYSVRQWVAHRGKLDTSPPWSERSTYSSILFRQMELESQMPLTHRFKASNFSDQYVATLSTNRLYWAPWLYLQMIYHAVVCTLNHPILLSLHLRRFKVNQIPELFLQHTADMISSHTDWMIHLITIANEKHFDFTNPALGQAVAIVGTIFLQQSYTEDQKVRLEKQSKFTICLQFVDKLGTYWPAVLDIAHDLRRLEAKVARAYNSSATEQVPNRSQHVDLTSFWRIMDNTLASSSPRNASIFGNTLTATRTASNEAEVLSTRPIPEPTRVHSLASHQNTAASTPTAPSIGTNGQTGETVTDFLDLNSPFLAQDYFAMGQDFVGNVDDWFSFEGLNT